MKLGRNLGRPLLAVALATSLGAIACSESSTGLDNVASVRLDPESPSVDVGLSVQFTAQALDAGGNVIPGISFTWASSNSGVATVDENGLAVGFAVGTTAITASAGAATPGSQVLAVEPSHCTDRVDVVLDAGEFQSYPGDTCLFLPTGSSGDRYRIAISRPTLIADALDVPNVALYIDPVLSAEQHSGAEPVVEPFAPTPSYALASGVKETLARIDGTRFVRDQRIMDATRRYHAELRRRDAELALRSRGGITTSAARAAAPTRVDPPSRDDLYLVIDCTASATRTPVKLVNFNDDVAIYQDSVGYQSAPLSPAATDLMLDYYADYVQDLITDYWGDTPDIDGNGRVILTTSASLPDSAAAAVFSGDFRPPSDCASSNQGEVMYFQTSIIAAIDDADPSYLALSVMAHEVKHVISLHNSIARGTHLTGPAFQDLWIEEGTAEISQTMSSRVAWAAIGGPAVGEPVTGDALISTYHANGDAVPPEMYGVVTEISDVIVHFSTQPNSLITNPDGASEFHTFYAGSWHWHRFLGDAYGDAATPYGDAPMFREMTDSLTPAGSSAQTVVTGRSFEQLYEDLVVGMAFHETAFTPTRAFTTWDLRTATAIFTAPPEVAPPGLYPWPVTTDASDGSLGRNFTSHMYSCPPQVTDKPLCPIGPSGVRFHEFVSRGTGAGAQIRVTGVPDGRITVARIN